MASNWNRYTERVAASDLGARDIRVLSAIARKTLGFNKPADKIAASQIAKLTGIGRNHVATILGALESRGVIVRVGGCIGRPATISINLETPWKRVPSAGHANLSRPRDTPKRKRVPQEGSKPVPSTGHTRGKGVNQKQARKTFQNLLADSYLGGGGNLELHDWRQSLFGQAQRLRKEGVADEELLDAARSLGRDRAFPGLLKQRVTELREQGGLCHWNGLNRARLTTDQLTECGCNRCTEWANHQAEPAGKARVSTSVLHPCTGTEAIARTREDRR